jgi:hypothetical protein
LTTGQDKSRSSERTGRRSTVTESKDLSESNGLLSAFSKESGANIEITRVQEGEDVRYRGRSVEAAILVLLNSQVRSLQVRYPVGRSCGTTVVFQPLIMSPISVVAISCQISEVERSIPIALRADWMIETTP